MRMSCNGCRVLRKACSDDCPIRPCLRGIKSPESQANATLFLAKFYGRAGLLNLIGAGPKHLQPAIFRSLLYEACGRMVNPVYGSVGTLWTGNWAQCQSAVEGVLRGSPQFLQSPSLDWKTPAAYDIRHFKRAARSTVLHKVRTGGRFKPSRTDAQANISCTWLHPCPISYEETIGHEMLVDASNSTRDDSDNRSTFSVETVECSLVNGSKSTQVLTFDRPITCKEENRISLELSLGLLAPQG